MNDQNGQQNQNNKTYTYVGIIILILVIAAVGIYTYNHKKNNGTGSNGDSSLQGIPDNIVGQTPTSTDSSVSGSGSGKLSYGDAIKKYTTRFQFSKCLGTPASIVIKKGSPVMLDNRDTVARTIVADKQTFRIGAYDYAILYPQVIGNMAVTCDGVNRVMLNVEK